MRNALGLSFSVVKNTDELQRFWRLIQLPLCESVPSGPYTRADSRCPAAAWRIQQFAHEDTGPIGVRWAKPNPFLQHPSSIQLAGGFIIVNLAALTEQELLLLASLVPFLP